MVFPRYQLVYVFSPQVEKNFYDEAASENLTRQTEFFTHIKFLIHCLSVKPEIFSVSA